MKKIKLIFAWYDIWIGIFYDKKKEWIYILPVPCFGIMVKLLPDDYSIYKVPIHQQKPSGSYLMPKNHLFQIFRGEELVGTFASDHSTRKLRKICWKHYKLNAKKQ